MKTPALLRTMAPLGAVLLLTSLGPHGLSARDLPTAAGPPPPSPPAESTLVLPSGAASPVHGITVRLTLEGRVVVATCSYDGGTPVAGATVTWFAPGLDAPYQTGATDPAGLSAFVPGGPGEWRAVVDDGMGHRREARIQVSGPPWGGNAGGSAEASAPPQEGDHGDHVHDEPGGAEHPAAHTEHAGTAEQGEPVEGPANASGSAAHTHSLEPGGSDRPWKLATGLGLIFGLTGFAYGFTARRERA